MPYQDWMAQMQAGMSPKSSSTSNGSPLLQYLQSAPAAQLPQMPSAHSMLQQAMLGSQQQVQDPTAKALGQSITNSYVQNYKNPVQGPMQDGSPMQNSSYDNMADAISSQFGKSYSNAQDDAGSALSCCGGK